MNLEDLIQKIKEYEPELINVIFNLVFTNTKDIKNKIKDKFIKILDEEELKEKIFYNNEYLKMVILYDNLKVINEISFKNCLLLEDIVLSKNLKLLEVR